MAAIPETMTAVVLDAYDGAAGLRVEQRPVPQPGPGEVLIKIAASPINPSDLIFLDGQYGFRKPPPVVPGFEASGTVVATGGGLMGQFLNGKQVACVSQDKGDGVWAEYFVTPANYALPLMQGVGLREGAMSVVNPLTAVALVDIAKQGGHQAIISTAAASALGRMIIRLGQQHGITVVNIVRRDEQVTLLNDMGADVVLNSSDDDFADQLHETCRQHDVRQAFDAVGGPLTRQILQAMPKHSTVTIYGGLSMQPAEGHTTDFIFKNKAINGFWLTPWLTSKNIVALLWLWRQAQGLLGSTLKTEVQACYRFEDAPQAVRTYKANMSGGKVLFVAGELADAATP